MGSSLFVLLETTPYLKELVHYWQNSWILMKMLETYLPFIFNCLYPKYKANIRIDFNVVIKKYPTYSIVPMYPLLMYDKLMTAISSQHGYYDVFMLFMVFYCKFHFTFSLSLSLLSFLFLSF